MNLKIIVACALIFMGCNGTEVASPPSPGENAGPRKIDSPEYEIHIDLPQGWSLVEYSDTHRPGPEAFTDISSDTLTIAQISTGQSRFTMFYSVFQSGQNLEAFVRQRRPTGAIEMGRVTDPEFEPVDTAIYRQTESGPRGGDVWDVYFGVAADVVWLRVEAVGATQEERDRVLDTFFADVFPTIDFIPKI